MSDFRDLTGRVALITGSSRGIGFALAEALADAGATVVLNARSEDGLGKAKVELVPRSSPEPAMSPTCRRSKS